MKAPNIDKVQRIAYVNAYRRGFYRGSYTSLDALAHTRTEVDEFGIAILTGDRTNMAEEGGDIILSVLSNLHILGIKGSDAIMAAINKELLKESAIEE
jgi:NTP pyrophosphatase (non-canonical NTP hydrolase)